MLGRATGEGQLRTLLRISCTLLPCPYFAVISFSPCFIYVLFVVSVFNQYIYEFGISTLSSSYLMPLGFCLAQ